MPSRFVPRGSIVVGAALVLAACSQGTQGAASAPQPAASKASSLPEGVTPLMIASGDSIFHKGSCQRCHGMDAKGTPRGVDLTDDTWIHIKGTYPEIVKIVTDGIPKEEIKLATAQFPMRPRGGSNLTDEQIRDVAAYVYSLSHH